jgi:hypothetical protein
MSSEVETSLIVNSHLCPAITISGFMLSRIAIIRSCTSASRTAFRAGSGSREGPGANFPALYQWKKLIYYEHYRDIRDAIARESQLKKWSRAKKVALINRMNPSWLDLGADVPQDR